MLFSIVECYLVGPKCAVLLRTFWYKFIWCCYFS